MHQNPHLKDSLSSSTNEFERVNWMNCSEDRSTQSSLPLIHQSNYFWAIWSYFVFAFCFVLPDLLFYYFLFFLISLCVFVCACVYVWTGEYKGKFLQFDDLAAIHIEGDLKNSSLAYAKWVGENDVSKNDFTFKINTFT